MPFDTVLLAAKESEEVIAFTKRMKLEVKKNSKRELSD